MKTALNATKLAIAAFVVPYVFALNPSMLLVDTNVIEVLQVILTSVVGIISIAAGLEGYLEGNLNWIFRILLIAAGLLLLVPGTLTDVVGIAALAIVFAFQILRRRKAQPA